MLEVSEFFRSLQGEGPNMGKPSFFLRLSGCVSPLCPFCDTPEGLGPGSSYSADQILQEIDPKNDRLVVITGGEPFRQWGKELEKLERQLISSGIAVQYETSGKVLIPEKTRGQIVCSPKFLENRWQFDLRNFSRNINAFKFVFDGDIQPILDFLDSHGIPRSKAWIMALGATRREQLEAAAALWTSCVNHGLNYSPRLHILTHDTRRSI